MAGYVLEHECGIRNFKIVSENRIEIYDLGKAVKEISALLVQNGVGINSIGRKQKFLRKIISSKLQEQRWWKIMTHLMKLELKKWD